MWFDADLWEAAGYPRALPMDRYVFAVIKERGPLSVRELSLIVWGSDNNRATAKTIVDRLSRMHLIEEFRGRWMEAGLDRHMVESYHGRILPCENPTMVESYQLTCEDPTMGNFAPCEDSTRGLVGCYQITDSKNDPENRVENEVGHNSDRERAHERTQAPAHTPARRQGGGGFIDEEKEKTSSSPNPLSNIDALKSGAKIPTDFERWNPLDYIAEIDPETAPEDPKELDLWLRFAANCATWSVTINSGRRDSPKHYRDSLVKKFRRDLEDARDEMSNAIALASHRKEAAKEAAEAEAKKAAVLEAASVPTLPTPKADDPTMAPHAWLIGQSIDESAKLWLILRSADPRLSDLARQAIAMRRQSETDWARATERLDPAKLDGWRALATHHRQRYLGQVKKLVALAPASALEIA